MSVAVVIVVLIVCGILGAMAVRALGGNIALIEDWKKAFSYYSQWVWGLMLVLPTAINQAAAEGLFALDGLGSTEAWIIRGTALLGLFSRLIAQRPKPAKPVFDETPAD